MNKKSRLLIFGLFAILICGTATAIHISNMYNGIWINDIFHWVIFILSLVGCIASAININQSLK